MVRFNNSPPPPPPLQPQQKTISFSLWGIKVLWEEGYLRVDRDMWLKVSSWAIVWQPVFKLEVRALKNGYTCLEIELDSLTTIDIIKTSKTINSFFETYYRWVYVSNRNVNKIGLIISKEGLTCGSKIVIVGVLQS